MADAKGTRAGGVTACCFAVIVAAACLRPAAAAHVDDAVMRQRRADILRWRREDANEKELREKL